MGLLVDFLAFWYNPIQGFINEYIILPIGKILSFESLEAMYSKWFEIGRAHSFKFFKVLTLWLCTQEVSDTLMWYGPIYPYLAICGLLTPVVIFKQIK